MSATTVVLSGDIGGTNSRLDLFEVDTSSIPQLVKGKKPPGKLVLTKKYLNHDFEEFDDIVRAFLDEAGKGAPRVACLAVAGPVKGNRVEFTNRAGWAVDGSRLEAEFSVEKALLINDFMGVAYGLLTLEDGPGSTDVHRLRGGPEDADPTGVIACVGAGTGLGMCYLSHDSQLGYVGHASEGGHADWSPRSALQVALLEFLKAKFTETARVSNERVVSGIGLANIYDFLRQHKPPSQIMQNSGAAAATAPAADGEVEAEGCVDYSQMVDAKVDSEIASATAGDAADGSAGGEGAAGGDGDYAAAARAQVTSACGSYGVGDEVRLAGTGGGGGRWHGRVFAATIIDVRQSDGTVKVQYASDGGFKRFARAEFEQSRTEDAATDGTGGSGSGSGNRAGDGSGSGIGIGSGSGRPGLHRSHSVLIDYQYQRSSRLDAEIKHAGDMRAAVIARAASPGGGAPGDALCCKAMEILVSAYGSVCGSALLTWLPRGGLFVAGGLAPKNMGWIAGKPFFMRALEDKGRLSHAIATIPVTVVLNEDVGRQGAQFQAVQLLVRMLRRERGGGGGAAGTGGAGPGVGTTPAPADPLAPAGSGGTAMQPGVGDLKVVLQGRIAALKQKIAELEAD